MQNMLLKILALLFPWIALFICDKPLKGFVALILQLFVIGWPIASFMAWREVKRYIKAEKEEINQTTTEK